jgi:hypothetical protein
LELRERWPFCSGRQRAGIVSTSDQWWDKVVGDFRQVCLLRRQKRWREADRILKEELPHSIAGWSASYPADHDTKSARLDSMFELEQRRIADAWLLQQLVMTQLHEQIIPAVCLEVGHEVRSILGQEVSQRDEKHSFAIPTSDNPAAIGGRVRFDDIPGVIDLILTEKPSVSHSLPSRQRVAGQKQQPVNQK